MGSGIYSKVIHEKRQTLASCTAGLMVICGDMYDILGIDQILI
jgi:hypothetical protein